MALAGMPFPGVVLPVMLLRLVGVMFWDVLLRRVVRAQVLGVLGGMRMARAQQNTTLQRVELRKPHRASRGPHRGGSTAKSAIGIAARIMTYLGPPARL